jgi:hypothetical protein
VKDMVWTARQASSPPLAATFRSIICAALSAGGLPGEDVSVPELPNGAQSANPMQQSIVLTIAVHSS